MNHSLRSLLPTFLLIAIYFVADEFFGSVVGICTAFVLGSAEFIYTRIREKVYDRMILLTTLFFCFPGLLILLSGDATVSRLQPVIIEGATCVLLGIFAFSHTDLTASLPAGYRKNLHLTEQQIQQMRGMMRILFFTLCAHTLLSLCALLWMTETIGSFISGPLLYIAIGCFFLFLFIRNRRMIRQMKKEEWLPIVNEQGEVTGKAPRRVCHSGTKLLHPVVHLHLMNEQGAIFLQKRSMKKKLLPGMWDTAVGGHIGLNESVEEALKRETFEELGITDFEARPLHSYLWESPRERELVFSFLCIRHNEVHIENDEVEEGRFWTRQEIENKNSQKLLTPNFIHEYELLLRKIK
ncbi:MAG: NUDIX domain-containing protein [Odoribacter sp.]